MRLPAHTFFQGELLLPNGNGDDDRTNIASLGRAKVATAQAKQQELGLAQLSFFNLWMYDGAEMVATPYQSRYDQLAEHFDKYGAGLEHVSMVEILPGTLEEADARVATESWEGLVLYDRTAGSRVKTCGGSIPRPQGCWKRKPINEDDFVAYDYVVSTATSHSGGVKEFKIGQYHPDTGELIPVGVVGGGISREQRLALNRPECYPFTIQVQYEKYTKHGKLSHARMLEIRHDKPHAECIMPRELLELQR